MRANLEKINTRLLTNVLFLALSFLLLLNLFLTESISETIERRTPDPIEITYLVDTDCSNCYDVTLHRKAVQTNFGVRIADEEYIDRGEAQEIIDKYNITKLPTVIISSQAKQYPFFEEAFTKVGTKEKDGAYVFRKPEYFGKDKFVEVA